MSDETPPEDPRLGSSDLLAIAEAVRAIIDPASEADPSVQAVMLLENENYSNTVVAGAFPRPGDGNTTSEVLVILLGHLTRLLNKSGIHVQLRWDGRTDITMDGEPVTDDNWRVHQGSRSLEIDLSSPADVSELSARFMEAVKPVLHPEPGSPCTSQLVMITSDTVSPLTELVSHGYPGPEQLGNVLLSAARSVLADAGTQLLIGTPAQFMGMGQN